MATVSARIVSALQPAVTEVFGVMGNGNAHFLDAVMALPDSMHYTAVRHEAGAVAAADAYFRASGRLAVATTTYGAGFTNALTPLAEAVQAQIPLVLVVGDAPTTGARPWDVDQVHLAKGLGATTFTVSATRALAVTAAAMDHALRYRQAVVLAIPYDLAGMEAAHEDLPPTTTAGPLAMPHADDIERIASLLSAATRPLILAGRGAWVSGAQDAATSLAERIGALTATSGLGAGFFGDNPTGLGIAGGWASERTARLIGQADVVLVLGARLNQFTTRFGHSFDSSASVVQVDVETGPTAPEVTDYLRGDARAVAEALLRTVDRVTDQRWSDVAAADAHHAHHARDDGDLTAPDGRLDPRSLCRTLDRLLPEDRSIVQDGGHFIGWAPGYFRVPAPNRLIMVGTAYQTIGLGLPSAVGAARALPESTVVLCTGDGGALMALADLDSFIRTARRAVIVVFNDAAYGAEIHQYAVRGIHPGPMMIDEVDFAALAIALGATGRTIRTLADLDGVKDWLASDDDGVLLLDCKVSQQVVAPYMEEIVAVATGGR
ncbi:thiamine pyrophosphate-binding protein [Arthrobacter cheniae]|uniref:Thiamine pyrophosphate-binding protein n=1 Tax=Arthrobacter cheniae TaxID=1258888 RepID=A0A3A5M9R2_9MICC|nr:thiamine pyrophosphate-binding protein [Arthrobacter cheniae]RJT76210.1 thiamine pyrophosphate-binding protein [Arthrobacter cheniae]